MELQEEKRQLEERRASAFDESMEVVAHEVEQKEKEIEILQEALARVESEAKRQRALADKNLAAKRVGELEDLVENLKEENIIIKQQLRETIGGV